MTAGRISKGDKVTPEEGGPVMDVLAASDHWAICGWKEGPNAREAILELRKLRRVAVQQQAQPQPTKAPGR